MKIGLKLKEVQVSPGSINSIVNLASCITALRTRKFASSFEIYVDVKLFPFHVEADGLDEPRRFQVQGQLEEFFL